MRTPLVLCSIVMLGVRIACASEDTYSLSFTKALLQLPPGVSISVVEKQIHRLGDRMAVALIKILDDEDLHNPQTIKKILPLLRKAFAFPELISDEEDKKPRVTFFLLRELEERTHEGDLKNAILETMQAIRADAG